MIRGVFSSNARVPNKSDRDRALPNNPRGKHIDCLLEANHHLPIHNPIRDNRDGHEQVVQAGH
jgi:hypothetical protein